MHWIVWSSVGVLGSPKVEFRQAWIIGCEVAGKSGRASGKTFLPGG